MSKYLVKFKEEIVSTPKAVLLLTWDNKEVWLPLKCIWPYYKYTKGIAYIVPDWLYDEKGLNGKPYEPYHHPEKISPVYNQEPIDDLKL